MSRSGVGLAFVALAFVACGEHARVVSLGPDSPPLVIVTDDLTTAEFGQPVSIALVARGGTPPYRWDVDSLQLPPGVVLTSDKLRGVSAMFGTFSFDVSVVDAVGTGAQKNLTLEVYPPPTPGVLRVVSRSPSPEEAEVEVSADVVVTFDRLINAISVGARSLTVRAEPGGVNVLGSVRPNARSLVFTPSAPFGPGQRYRVELGAGVLSASGDRLDPNELLRWSFTTSVPNVDTIFLRTSADRVRYVPDQERLYVLNYAARKMIVVDLAAKSIVANHTLRAVPDDVCAEANGVNAWVVSQGSTSITQLDTITGAVLQTLQWSAPEWSPGSDPRLPHFHIFCRPNELVLVDGMWSPSLWTIPLTDGPRTPVDHTLSVTSIGDLVWPAGANTFYYWHQFGWSAGWAGTNVYRVERRDDGQFEVVDESDIGYPAGSRDPLDTPIFWDEDRGLVVSKRFILDARDLHIIHFTLPEDEEIYAADLTRGRIASKRNVYDLERFEVIAQVPFVHADHMLFDGAGTLYTIEKASGIIRYAPVE